MADPTPALIEAARNGDESAFGELVRSHYERVYRHLWAFVRHDHDARDLSQETWIKAWDGIQSFRGDAPFGAWVTRIATRTALDFLRKRKRMREVALPDQDAARCPVVREGPRHETPDRAAQSSEIQDRFQAALSKLPIKQRAVLALREIEGLSYAEIAHALGCRKGTVMSRLFNARKAIQSKLKDLL
ncbi:MAG: sigma-70 family RNA polymerase sigma factor [Opitutaceae bacterium]